MVRASRPKEKETPNVSLCRSSKETHDPREDSTSMILTKADTKALNSLSADDSGWVHLDLQDHGQIEMDVESATRGSNGR